MSDFVFRNSFPGYASNRSITSYSVTSVTNKAGQIVTDSIIPATPGGSVLISTGTFVNVVASSGIFTTLSSNYGLFSLLNMTGTGKIQYSGQDFITSGPGIGSLSVGVGSKGYTANGNTVIGNGAGTSIVGNNNTVLGYNSGTTLTNGRSNVIVGRVSNAAGGCEDNVILGNNISLGDPTTACIIIGNGSNPIASNTYGTIAIGYGNYVGPTNTDSGSVLLGLNTSLQGNKPSGNSVIIGSGSGDGSNGTGNVLLGANILITGTFSQCVCLGNNAPKPTESYQLTLNNGMIQNVRAGTSAGANVAPFTGVPSKVLIVTEGTTTYQIPMYATS